ncbi:MAG: hypothetical protein CL676_06040, partial [Bdellovibrionaceae bacterium]|nr:hypothetical protein [Pseudobdellovibrionaceae bacterium]
MFQSKELSLKSILGSKEGVHLTSYLLNQGDELHLKNQIYDSMAVAREHLTEVLTEEELKHFLSPLMQLLMDSQILKNFKSNIGIFRTKDSFRMLNVPIEVQPLCVVATSFHVKPLLRWIHADREFLVLGIEEDSVSLYSGTQSGRRHLATLDISTESQKFGNKVDRFTHGINEWLSQIATSKKAPLFLAGSQDLVKEVVQKLKYPAAKIVILNSSFDRDESSEIFAEARQWLQAETRRSLEDALIEFQGAEKLKQAQKNIFQIAKAAVKGRISKLFVTEGIQIFGKLDSRTGGVSINPDHMDHEDDDLLDDLAQTV